MARKSLSVVLDEIGSLTNEEQVVLVRRLRTVLNPPAQKELSDRVENGL